MKILIVSVGGSARPVILSIQKNKPDYVYFICSEDSEGAKNGSWRTVEREVTNAPRVCEKCQETAAPVKEKSLVEQAELVPGSYEILRVNCDKVYDVYELVWGLIEKHIRQGDKVTVDYTGGTKSMSAGCVAAAMEELECEMSVVSGDRMDLLRVRDGQERFRKIRENNKAFIRRQRELVVRLFDRRDYEGALAVLDKLCDNDLADTAEEKQQAVCRALVHWDHFEWEKAAVLRHYAHNESIKSLVNQLGLVRDGLHWYKNKDEEAKPRHNYAPVYDLLLNGERRAEAGLYDDAISRVYRAVEMYAQFCLKNHQPSLDTGNLQLERLPEELRSHYETWRAKDGLVKIGLETSYDLLAALNHPVGQVWGSRENKGERKRVLEMMKKRNYSFLAHGMEPLKREDWLQVKDVVWNFVHKADGAMKLRMPFQQFRQLPQNLGDFYFLEK